MSKSAAEKIIGGIREAGKATGGATASRSLDAAIDALPGVQEQRSTFNQIIGVTAVVAAVVIALFFALITVERSGLYGVLKAVGASSAGLFAAVSFFRRQSLLTRGAAATSDSRENHHG